MTVSALHAAMMIFQRRSLGVSQEELDKVLEELKENLRKMENGEEIIKLIDWRACEIYTHIIQNIDEPEEEIFYMWSNEAEDFDKIMRRFLAAKLKEDEAMEEYPTDEQVELAELDPSNYNILLTFRGALDPITSNDVTFYDTTDFLEGA